MEMTIHEKFYAKAAPFNGFPRSMAALSLASSTYALSVNEPIDRILSATLIFSRIDRQRQTNSNPFNFVLLFPYCCKVDVLCPIWPSVQAVGQGFFHDHLTGIPL